MLQQFVKNHSLRLSKWKNSCEFLFFSAILNFYFSHMNSNKYFMFLVLDSGNALQQSFLGEGKILLNLGL